uniref:Phage protein n=1 Tax=Nonomuraea gerenzanensis TaxID=93944 RepID=A0A1M4DVJ5_9ACTN|nr:Phage protein [Nonomuraea gerenzanensis]
MTLTDDGKVVITLKGGPGFEAPWIVIHAGSVDEAEDTLDEVYSKGLQHKVTKAAAAFSTGGSSGGRTASRSNPPGVASKTCQHGEMTYRTGTSAKGAWKAYFCPAEDKNEQCSPVWVK